MSHVTFKISGTGGRDDGGERCWLRCRASAARFQLAN